MRFSISFLAALTTAHVAKAQLQSQNFTWNSTFSLSQDQITAANLSASEVANFEIALNFERSNYAGGSVLDDPFYTPPASFDPANPPPPGTLLRVEERSNVSLYTLAPSLSLSRILYTTETLNGTSIPASAYVLRPYTPRSFPGLTCASNGSAVFPTVGLAHGTSGWTPECAPSHIRALWDDFHEPIALALNGYAVVAPDYAGLGVSTVPSPYFVLPTQANDLAYAVVAAQKASLGLSKEFVMMGQSQGGGVSWSYAQRQAQKPLPGYLGTVTVSPFTDIYGSIAADNQIENNVRVLSIAQGLSSVLPSFNISEWLTPYALNRLPLLKEVRACSSSSAYILTGKTLQDGWQNTASAKWYFNVSDNGNKPFADPLLVLQGDQDANANVNVTANAVNSTCALFPDKSLQYNQYAGISHVPTLYASQPVWLDFIRDRFNGVKTQQGCIKNALYPASGVANGAGQNWVVEFDKYGL